MFATPELAARIDRAEGNLCAGIARAAKARDAALGSVVIDVAGGVAVFAGVGSPTHRMIGVGFGPLPTEQDVARIERVFADHGADLQAEVSSLADPALYALLVDRGYVPRGFENVLGHPLAGVSPAAPHEITVERASVDDQSAWLDAAVAAVATPDTGGVGGDAIPPSDELRRWMAPAIEVPAMLRGRLARARDAHREAAVVATQPASKSQENVQREGFSLLYVRQLLVKPPA